MDVTRKNSKLAVGFTLDKDKPSKSKGFTLIELLVVMAILGILAVVGISSFRTSLAKSRDAKRKSDLEQVQRALEMYFNDHGKYPLSTQITWGGIFSSDGTDAGTIYMKELPKDPSGNPEYCYRSPAPSPAPSVSYQIYATLENSGDSKYLSSKTCNSISNYHYGVSSSNTVP